jgi:hypothetical protein
MSDIGIFSTFDLFVMAFVAGSPGLVLGAITGWIRWRSHRLAGSLTGGVVGFAFCLAAVLVWVLWLK